MEWDVYEMRTCGVDILSCGYIADETYIILSAVQQNNMAKTDVNSAYQKQAIQTSTFTRLVFESSRTSCKRFFPVRT